MHIRILHTYSLVDESDALTFGFNTALVGEWAAHRLCGRILTLTISYLPLVLHELELLKQLPGRVDQAHELLLLSSGDGDHSPSP